MTILASSINKTNTSKIMEEDASVTDMFADSVDESQPMIEIPVGKPEYRRLTIRQPKSQKSSAETDEALRLLSRAKVADSGRVSADDEESECPPLPDSVRMPDSLAEDASIWLDAYVGFSRTWSPRSFDGFHEACALWLLSTIAARRIVFHYGGERHTNLYLMMSGRTTLHAKSTAAHIARDVLLECKLGFFRAADESTPQSFISSLKAGELPYGFDDLPSEIRDDVLQGIGFAGQKGWFYEEFGSGLASMMRTDGVMADFRGLLRKFDDCPPEYRRSTIARGEETVERPYLSLLANLTPADLRPLAKKGTPLWGDGFFARFAFVTPPTDEILRGKFPKGERKIPESIIDRLVEWHHRLGLPAVEIEEIEKDGESKKSRRISIDSPPITVIELPQDVVDASYAYNIALLEIAHEHPILDLDGNYGRLHEKALRIAVLLASLEGHPQVEMRHWAKAQQIAEGFRVYLHRIYHQVTMLDESGTEIFENNILRTIKRLSGSEKYPGGMTASQISAFIHGASSNVVLRIADGLVAAGALKEHHTKRAKRYRLLEEYS